jgi:SAM-dependent methyltransferase
MLPYKYAFRRYLGYLLDVAEDFESVLDFACERGKFRDYFGSIKYVGMDVDSLSISIAQKRYPKDSFMVADITKPCIDFAFRFDLVVSTHTLGGIPEESARIAVSNLINATNRESGQLLIQCPRKLYKSIENVFHDEFVVVLQKSYRGIFSRLLEPAQQNGLLKTRIGGQLSRLLSFVDIGRADVIVLLKRQ